MSYLIKEMNEENYKYVKYIYEQGINSGVSTFQKIAPDWEKFNRDHINACRLVCMKDNMVCGWTALSHISIMEALGGVAELNIYVMREYMGQGIGTTLINELCKEAYECGFWSLQSTILPENCRSIALHKKCGFRKIGYREKIAQMPDGSWRDVFLFEKRLKDK